MTEDGTSPTNGVIAESIFSLQYLSGHNSKSGRWPNFDKAFKVMGCEENVLGFNPLHRIYELVGEKFNKNDVCELLSLSGRIPMFFIPFLQNLVQTRRQSLIVDELDIIL